MTSELQRRLEEIRAQGLFRELTRVDSPQTSHALADGREMLNFSSNDYLGLANHPAVKESVIKAVEKYGAGSGASRLISGSLAPHHELEAALAEFKGTESALSFSSGYAAAAGVICALAGKDDIIVLDKLVHACIVDAARLTRAELRIFAHNDLDLLEDILKWCVKKTGAATAVRPRTLIITESVFSMDGDLAPLAEIVRLKEKYGAWLMVDEAHATGLYGPQGRGLAAEMDVSSNIEVQMGTLGKALGSAGGFIAGSKTLTSYLVNKARSFIFSTAPVPAAAAASLAGVRIAQSQEGSALRNHLWSLVGETKKVLRAKGWPVSETNSAILPLIVGEESGAVQAARDLKKLGIWIPAIRYPTVAKGAARLRLTLTAAHSHADIETLARALEQVQLKPADEKKTA